MDAESALRLVRSKAWHHDFEILPGVRTNGTYDPAGLWTSLELDDDLTGLTIADVGASNGYFSFAARRRGARVVAFDYRHKDNSGFGLAQHLNGIHDIEHHQVNVLELDARQHGTFDVVLLLGVLYHVADPYRALANCAGMARRRLIVESYCIDSLLTPEARQEPFARFMSDPKRFPVEAGTNVDRTNFWGFTAECLRRMIDDVGFVARRIRAHGDRVLLDAERMAPDAAGTREVFAYGRLPAVPAGADRDAPDAWTIF